MNEFDKWIYQSHEFQIVPEWIARAIQDKNPRMTMALASTKEYQISPLDSILGTTPFIQKITIDSLN